MITYVYDGGRMGYLQSAIKKGCLFEGVSILGFIALLLHV